MLCTSFTFSQEITKTIRGKVLDKDTYEPLIGVKITLVGIEPFNATISDFEGNFRLENVPIGRHKLLFTLLGYETQVKSNIDVSAADVVLNVEMIEAVRLMNAVQVEGQQKGESINKMATVSVRSFSVEESNRYAGSKNDVARMAQNYAGVQGADDSRNDIVIRGNSPSGVLFRMEGIDIPNPNHFARFGTTGGPVSMLNNNVMANSDFLTGAFPAEYGNAIAGVFDLKLRNGNNEKHNFMFQFGFNGAELMAEGPISKKNKSSYLVNYRYSTLQLFKYMGINFGSTAIPKYQDGSFKLHFPFKKGYTSIFGIGGLSAIDIRSQDADSTDLFAIDYSNTSFRSNVGVLGLTHRHRIGKTGYLNLSIGIQGNLNSVNNDTVDFNFENAFTTYASNSRISRQTADVFYNRKFNTRHLIKVGVHTDVFFLNLNDSLYNRETTAYDDLRNYQGNTFFWQPYAQYQIRITKDLLLNLGAHAQGLSLNNDFTIEPRAGVAWNLNEKNKLSFGYGLHSQMQPIELYYYQIQVGENLVQPSKDLSFTKSHHFVLGYQRRFKHKINAKVEGYYQYLYDVPVQVQSSSYSILNFGADFTSIIPADLESEGEGTNYGVELTLEKFLDKGFYFLVTSSLYESFYTASNGKKYNTAFNGNFTFNALAGYEFRFGNGKNSITVDGKFTLNGGKKYTPILLEESILANQEVRDNENAFSARYPNYVRGDIRLAFKTVGEKVTQEWAIDMQNFTNRQNIFYQAYNVESQGIKITYQTGFLPIGQYRIYF
jgi:hypothetical protein